MANLVPALLEGLCLYIFSRQKRENPSPFFLKIHIWYPVAFQDWSVPNAQLHKTKIIYMSVGKSG